jgi:hypothetical protein
MYDVVDELKEGDVVIKGANCLDLIKRKAGVLIGHPKGGIIMAILQAVAGKRVKLVLPIGLEKRISDDIDDIASILNSPGRPGCDCCLCQERSFQRLRRLGFFSDYGPGLSLPAAFVVLKGRYGLRLKRRVKGKGMREKL